jgi:tetratricopeptide (TPR) repeat protein
MLRSPFCNPITRATLFSIALALILPQASTAGQFKAGLGKGESLKASVPLAPEVRIPVASISIDVRDSNPVRSARTDAIAGRIRSALENTLAGGPWTIAPAASEASIRVAISEYLQPQSTLRQVQRVMQVPRVAPNGAVLVDAYGRPIYINRRVVVDQWTGRGRAAFRAEVVDTKSGAVVDTFTGGANFENQADVAVNGVAQVDHAQIPNQDQIEAKLISDIATQFAKRYNPGSEEIEIPLSVAEELRVGNKLVKSGDYNAAIESWQAAVPRKLDTLGDKLHNPGCAFEMLAYGLLRESRGRNTEGVRESLEKAIEAYSAALKQDPKEKYFQQALDRVRRAAAVNDRFQALRLNYEQAVASALRPSPWPPQAPPSKKYVVVTETASQEDQFRDLVKARFKALETKPDSSLQTQLENLGVSGYGLSTTAARRIIEQELEETSGTSSKILAYRETYLALKKDGQITPDERKILETLAANLGLSRDQAQRTEDTAKP